MILPTAGLKLRSLDDFDQLDVKHEVLAGERVVGVDGDGLLVHAHHGDRQHAAIGGAGLELGADLEVDAGGDLVAVELLDGIVTARAIGGLGGDGHGALGAGFHAIDMLLEPLDHLALAKSEFERRAAFGAVELGAIGETAGIMDAHSVAGCGSGHGTSLSELSFALARRRAFRVSRAMGRPANKGRSGSVAASGLAAKAHDGEGPSLGHRAQM